MNSAIEGIDLSSYSVDQLDTLVEMAKAEINHKQQARLYEVRQQIEDLAAEAGMSLEDLLMMKSGGRKKGNGKPAVAAKYRNPADPSQTWSGRGKRPRWFNELMDAGYEPGELAA